MRKLNEFDICLTNRRTQQTVTFSGYTAYVNITKLTLSLSFKGDFHNTKKLRENISFDGHANFELYQQQKRYMVTRSQNIYTFLFIMFAAQLNKMKQKHSLSKLK